MSVAIYVAININYVIREACKEKKKKEEKVSVAGYQNSLRYLLATLINRGEGIFYEYILVVLLSAAL